MGVSGTIFVRDYQRESGFIETTFPFDTLEDLFELCQGTVSPSTVDRIEVIGQDSSGLARTLRLKLESVRGSGLHQASGSDM